MVNLLVNGSLTSELHYLYAAVLLAAARWCSECVGVDWLWLHGAEKA